VLFIRGLMIAVENGPDHMVYAGPVLSHYEFIAPGLQRWTDEEWQWGGFRDRPEWTQDYLVPR